MCVPGGGCSPGLTTGGGGGGGGDCSCRSPSSSHLEVQEAFSCAGAPTGCLFFLLALMTCSSVETREEKRG